MTGLETRFTRRLRRPWTVPRGVAESSCGEREVNLASRRRRRILAWRKLLNYTRLTPLIEFWERMMRHIDGVCAWAPLRLTNATLEGNNSRVRGLEPARPRLPQSREPDGDSLSCVLAITQARRAITRSAESGFFAAAGYRDIPDCFHRRLTAIHSLSVSPRSPLDRTEAATVTESGLRPPDQIEKQPDRTKPEQSTVLATPVFCPTDGVHLSLG